MSSPSACNELESCNRPYTGSSTRNRRHVLGTQPAMMLGCSDRGSVCEQAPLPRRSAASSGWLSCRTAAFGQTLQQQCDQQGLALFLRHYATDLQQLPDWNGLRQRGRHRLHADGQPGVPAARAALHQRQRHAVCRRRRVHLPGTLQPVPMLCIALQHDTCLRIKSGTLCLML